MTRDAITPLSPRETEVARLIADGLLDKEAAAVLQVSIGTLKKHVDRIAQKIGARHNRRIAIALWIERHESPKAHVA